MDIGQLLLQMIIILLLVQLFGHLCKRLGQQWVIGEILTGLVLGPSLLGAFWPGLQQHIFPASSMPVLDTLGQLGLILYMFTLGTRLEVSHLLHRGGSAIIISLNSILLPMLLGIDCGFFLYPAFGGPKATQLSFLLILGISMSITAFPVLARLLAETKLLATVVGTLALTSAATDDIVAWSLLACTTALIHAQGTGPILLIIGETVLFIGTMLLLVRPLLRLAVRRIHSKLFMGALVLVLMLTSAYITNLIGIHPVFGAFLLGVILPREATLQEQVRSADQINALLFLPLYFVYSGLRTQVGLLHTPVLILICLGLLFVAATGKIAGGTAGARLGGRVSWRDALSIGILLNTRGLVELIVLNIGLDLGVLSPTLFSMLVIMALVTTMMASPILALLNKFSRSTAHTPDPVTHTFANETEQKPQLAPTSNNTSVI